MSEAKNEKRDLNDFQETLKYVKGIICTEG